MECTGSYLIINEDARKCTDYDVRNVTDCLSVYEVIRLHQGVPLFLERHLSRISRSAAHIGKQFHAQYHRMQCSIRELARINGIRNGNIKITVSFDEQKEGPADTLLFFIPHRYPDATEYAEGVPMATHLAERPIPMAKTTNKPLRSKMDELLAGLKVYEILMVSRQGNITEGSRSNVFFVQGETLVTPPETDVLPGITRELVFEICHRINIPVREEKIPVSRIGEFEAAFITGTSPKVLPAFRIDKVNYSVPHPLTRRIMKAYDVMIGEYIRNFKPECEEVKS